LRAAPPPPYTTLFRARSQRRADEPDVAPPGIYDHHLTAVVDQIVVLAGVGLDIGHRQRLGQVGQLVGFPRGPGKTGIEECQIARSEEHTSELQSRETP